MSARDHHSATRLLALLFTGSLLPAHAQMHHVDKPEHVTRAVGVFEWTGDLAKPTASRFVPVSLYINGHFEDAGFYLARPVPFALQTGDLYAVEHAGEPAGLMELETAGRVVTGTALANDNTVGAWYGYGKFTPEAPPKPAPKLRPSAHPPVIQASSDAGHPHLGAKPGETPDAGDADHDRPKMTRRTGGSTDSGSGDDQAKDTSAGSSSKDTGTTGSGSGTQTTSRNDSSDDTDRPTLRRRDPSQDASRKRSVGGKAGQASVTAVGPQPGDDPDRPTLSRHTEGAQGPKELTGLPADMHQAVAVSDPVNRDAHPFARAWEGPAERAMTLQAMAALAKPKIEAYLAANHLVPSDATLAPEAPEPKPGQAPVTAAAAAATVDNSVPTGGPRLQRGKPQDYSGAAPSSAQPKVAPPSPAPSTPAQPTPAQPKAAPSSAARRPGGRAAHAAAKAPAAPLRFQEEQITGYTLSYGGLPTFVYTAAAASSVANPGGLPTAASNPTVYVTVVAQRLPSGELQPALDAVTDSTHLDRGPRLRLIDAVDPDASHRASLLFELRAGSSRQFALYRLITAKADQTFTTASIE